MKSNWISILKWNFIAAATDCPKNMERYTAVQDKLKLMTDIKPVVLQNVDAIIEKFPCNDDQVPTFLEDFVSNCFQTIHLEHHKEIKLFLRLGANNKNIESTSGVR